MNTGFRLEVDALVVKALAVIREHGPDHFDARGHCQCSERCCMGSEGRCFCADCPCSLIGKCEAPDGCVKCRPVTA